MRHRGCPGLQALPSVRQHPQLFRQNRTFWQKCRFLRRVRLNFLPIAKTAHQKVAKYLSVFLLTACRFSRYPTWTYVALTKVTGPRSERINSWPTSETLSTTSKPCSTRHVTTLMLETKIQQPNVSKQPPPRSHRPLTRRPLRPPQRLNKMGTPVQPASPVAYNAQGGLALSPVPPVPAMKGHRHEP